MGRPLNGRDSEKMKKSKISIGIILYRNPEREIRNCLNGLKTQTAISQIHEVVIRDQGGGDCKDFVEAWQKENGNALSIRFHAAKNSGFGAGHNALFRMASAESSAYLCLNPDGIMHPQCLEFLLYQAQLNGWRGIFEAIQEPVMHPKKFDPQTGETAWCSAACLLIPSAIYREMNGFDDDFFMYCEDVDLSWRVKAAGYHCYTCQDAWFFHYAMDRAAREVEIWRSACILAHKWRSAHFKKHAFNVLASLVDVDQEELREAIEKISQHAVGEIYRASPNFKNNLSFAEMMWNA
jgi:N-acetylglucosaminyl-diphospho-decaprenol L-rhamnosyltransferase